MYYPYFITYMLAGLAISLVVFFWALKNGQFNEQQRARYLPLEEDRHDGQAPVSAFNRYETYVLWFLAAAGLAASGAVLLFALLNA